MSRYTTAYRLRFITIALLLTVYTINISAQERVAPIGHNPILTKSAISNLPTAKKTATLNLPFFEDFTGYDVYPDPAKWIDRQVYINNTMCVDPISRGVATFDALNEQGLPYVTADPFAVYYADSLTSQPIDLSVATPADSVYLSFFYQPQGRGFAPEAGDSLLLFFRNIDSGWTKVWSKEGSGVHRFTPVMVAITDPVYFHSAFQFRFVNIASINLNDDVWNLDYIRLDRYRNFADTALNDLCTASEPTGILGDYTSMPYRQFLAAPGNERSASHHFNIRNNYGSDWNVQYHYTARDLTSGTILGSGNNNTIVPPGTEKMADFPNYTTTIPLVNRYDKVVWEHQYYFNSVSAADVSVNDTVVKRQVFDNYLAYDDGTAERSYFLNMWPSLPAKIAVEFHLNQPDTLQGIAIYFGRQVPLAYHKYFTLEVYKDLGLNGGGEQLIYQQELNDPGYADTVNQFWVYRFHRPVPLPAGTFYIGTSQPASSASDSLYFGLDVNRAGANYLYFNVLSVWEPSSVSGALMIRPLLGRPVVGSKASEMQLVKNDWRIYPNPVLENLYIQAPDSGDGIEFELYDISGRMVYAGETRSGEAINLTKLTPGVYLMNMISGEEKHFTRLIKY